MEAPGPVPTEPGLRAPSSPPRPPAPGPAASCPGAAFYGPLDGHNPLMASCEAHLRQLLAVLRARSAYSLHSPLTTTTSLFNIWTKFESRLPASYYNEKLLKVGDSLMQIKEYKLALTQCYGRYLQQFDDLTFDENKAALDEFKAIYFPEGFAHKSVGLTFQALQGRSICNFHMVCINDINLQNEESVRQSLKILSSLRLTMQMALPQEHLCWIVYNGTIHTYTICRKLMSIGQSTKALEYLLWSSICMESSIPLLSVNYLTWRTVLYTAVCQCYFDCQEGLHGEVFARRALSKIDELRTLEMMSSSPPQAESKKIYKEATIKMAVMIFKRAVFEPRRKPKGSLRPKVRINLKEAQTLQWPRTVTERLLTEMFENTASQFLAILEALSDSNRRTLQTGPPTVDEIEVRDVVLELFMAGLELLIGKVDGKNAISVDAAVRFIKLAFTYEDWNLFNSTVDLLLNFLKSQDDSAAKKSEMDLKLLVAMEPLINVKRLKGTIFSSECFRDGAPRGSGKKITVGHSDELINLAATLLSCISAPSQNIRPDREIVVDIVMFLWQKYKLGVQRMSISGDISGYDSLKFAQKIKVNKSVHLLWLINEILQCCKMENVDIVVVAEAALRLSEILEHLGYLSRKLAKTSDSGKRPSSELTSSKHLVDILPIIKKSPEERLFFAYENFSKAIDSMNLARSGTSLPNGLSVLDHCYTKLNTSEANGRCNTPVTANSFVMDLHLELIQAQHRIAVMLINQTSVLSSCLIKLISCFIESDVMNTIKKNKLSKAIFLMQKAELIFHKQLASVSPNHLLEEAFSLIQKTEAEQSALYSYQKKLEDLTKEKNRIPPPPILLSRSSHSMTFKPAPFTSDVKVSWYRIFGCKADGCIVKVRLNDDHLSSSGEVMPADGKSILEVKDLEANEKYVFAVAAYSSDGKLVGNAVGETTKPILAYSPLSTITVRTFLTQVAYQIGNYTLAKRAFSPIWDYFVSIPSSPSTNLSMISLSSKLSISQFRLIPEILSQTSSILLYLFLQSIFITSDIIIKEKNLFCDAVRGNDIYYCQQVGRLAECERLLVAIELSTWLNDANYVLQAVVQCYGLLAPIIYHNIALVPVIQVLIKCLVVLQEIPDAIFVKKQTGTFESIQHMIACSAFYTAKVLRSWKEYELAVIIINYGKKLLDSSGLLFANLSTPSKSSMTDEEQGDILEEVIFLLFSLSVTIIIKNHGSDLLWLDDPIFLYPIVFNWTTKCALREVMKFKHRPRFLEFLVQLMQKSLNEEKFFQLLEWSGPIQDFLKRPAGFTSTISPRSALSSPPKRLPYYYGLSVSRFMVCVTLKIFFLDRYARNDGRKMTSRILIELLSRFILNRLKRKRLHQLLIEEMPWRSQMNIYLAMAHFNVFRKQLEESTNIKVYNSQNMISYQTLDPDLFSLYNSGSLLVEGSNLNLENYKTIIIKLFVWIFMLQVLAHRGRQWTLLQNACRLLWNYSQDMHLLVKHANQLQASLPINIDILICALVLPFYFASDMLLDMVIDLQNTNSVKIVDEQGDFNIPSCFGSIGDDEGGSAFTFEQPLDDVTVVDLKWTCDFILKTLQILYQVEKWEALIHIAIQFNSITHEKYTGQVTPILVRAQRQLIERVQAFGGPEIPQPHFVKFETDHTEKITCRNYIGKQLRIATTSNEVINPESLIDHEGSSGYSDVRQASRLVCVPLDLTDTLKCFRETLGKLKFHSRSLRHSRKLLSLLLAQTQELLDSNNQTGLKVQALHELGNLLFFAGNKRMAFKYWCRALDGILRKSDVLNTWKEFDCFSVNGTDSPADAVLRDYSEKFLFQAGIWGCLQGAVIAAKLAQYILTSNMRQRTECCILSAFLFKALFRNSLPHPKVDFEFAQYEITKLAPGIDLFSDRYRADISTVVASLTFLICELHFAKQNLMTLPLFTLYQYFVSEICQDPLKCIEGRILKMQVLIDLGFFADAFNELSLLYIGKNIPCKVPSGYKSTGKLKPIQKFETDKTLLSKDNLSVMLNRGLPITLASLCNQQILNKLFLARMHFLISLAATINGLPEEVLRSLYCASTSIRSKSPVPNQLGLSSQLIKCKEDLTLNMLKGILLSEAEDRLNLLVADIQDGNDRMISQCSVVELEVVIEAKLQLAAIAQQRHQAAFSAGIAFSVLRTLQDAEVFKKMPKIHTNDFSGPTESESVHKEDTKYLEPSMMVAREHLDIRLWLRCRLALLAALVAQIRGIVVMKENETTECLSLIDQMLAEAEASGDIELQAAIMVQAVMLNLQERRPKANSIQLLQDIIHLLEEKPFISPQASLIFVQSILLLDDLMKMETDDIQGYHSSGKEKLNYLILSHKLIIEQILTFGETVKLHKTEVELTTPLQPLKNIYLPHINILAKVKMRLGYVLAKQVSCTAQRKDPRKWLPALQLLRTALELCRASAMEEFDLEAEILFQKGKVERQLFLVDNPKPMMNDDFFEAIKLSQRNDQNYGEAMVASQLLIGKKSVKEQPVKYAIQIHIPQFAYLDLLTSYTDYLTEVSESLKRVRKSESEVKKISEDQPTITWVHLVRYHNHLMRLNNMGTLLASKPVSVIPPKDDALYTSVFNQNLFLRLKEMHYFLKLFLREYSFCCVDEFPKDLLQGLEKPAEKTHGSVVKVNSVIESRATYAPHKELCFQWYIPPLEISAVPFDISLESILNLKKLFDLSNGCVLLGGSIFQWITSLLS
uniref:Cilia and flagella associated protein 54 n=1 Tax=Ornithorhynchus anatinus TaxID=9258 RepID=A0A6I8NGL9_ORNAN